ncbi:Na-translocating system protein MpsC family protein [Metabacillus sp. HB246100]
MEQDQLNWIGSFTSKLLRKNFGKGPQSCQATASEKHLVIYIRGFISPMEEVLIHQGQRNQVERARTVIINHVIEELTGALRARYERDVTETFDDWNFPNNSGMIMFKLDEIIMEGSVTVPASFTRLEQEVARISQLVQKVPDQIHIYQLSSTIYLVERIGILIPIEKALVRKGFLEELKLTKDELEKEYFHRYGKFDELLNAKVKDIFIDWDFKEDKSYMSFVVSS